jgi:hypothetical protein
VERRVPSGIAHPTAWRVRGATCPRLPLLESSGSGLHERKRPLSWHLRPAD